MTRELLPGELSWADSFIIDLLSDEEKHQDVIKDLTSSAVMGAIAKVAETSEEIALGYLGDYYTAIGKLDRVEDEVDEEVAKDASETSKDTGKANKEAYNWLDEEAFNIRLAELAAQYNVDLDIGKRLDETDSLLHRLIYGVDLELLAMQEGLELQQNELLDVVAEGTITLLALALGTVFDRFMDAFFEEV